jgi:hypothetical protein
MAVFFIDYENVNAKDGLDFYIASEAGQGG